jgi:hypothetical protein
MACGTFGSLACPACETPNSPYPSTGGIMHIRIIHENKLVADLPDWNDPLPVVGDYLFHPPQLGESSEPENLSAIAGRVIQRVWRMYERPVRKIAGEPDGFKQTHRPYVEIVLG